MSTAALGVALLAVFGAGVAVGYVFAHEAAAARFARAWAYLASITEAGLADPPTMAAAGVALAEAEGRPLAGSVATMASRTFGLEP